MSIYNVMPTRGASRPNLVVTARACRTDEGQLPVGVHGDDEHGMKPSDSPDHAGVDVVFLRTILQLLVLVTVAVGAIGVNIAIHSPPQERQPTSVVNLTSPADGTGGQQVTGQSLDRNGSRHDDGLNRPPGRRVKQQTMARAARESSSRHE